MTKTTLARSYRKSVLPLTYRVTRALQWHIWPQVLVQLLLLSSGSFSAATVPVTASLRFSQFLCWFCFTVINTVITNLITVTTNLTTTDLSDFLENNFSLLTADLLPDPQRNPSGGKLRVQIRTLEWRGRGAARAKLPVVGDAGWAGVASEARYAGAVPTFFPMKEKEEMRKKRTTQVLSPGWPRALCPLSPPGPSNARLLLASPSSMKGFAIRPGRRCPQRKVQGAVPGLPLTAAAPHGRSPRSGGPARPLCPPPGQREGAAPPPPSRPLKLPVVRAAGR